MKKGKCTIIKIASSVFIIAIICISFYHSTYYRGIENSQNTAAINVIHNTVSNDVVDYLNDAFINIKDIKVNGLYIDGSNNINELLQNADIIVKGIVNEIKEERLLGIVYSFNIERVVKGSCKKDESIYILTLKSGDQLKVGETYVFALGEDREQNMYYVKGGSQGRFSIKGEDIVYDDIIFKDDIDNILSVNTANKKDVIFNRNQSPLDKLCDEFEERLINQALE